jgi:hypothetical protein
MSNPCPPPPRPRHRPTGRERLALHIQTRHDGVVARFATEAKVSSSQLSRLLDGHRGAHLSVDLAWSIERASGGEVPWYTWTRTGRPPVASTAARGADAPDAEKGEGAP